MLFVITIYISYSFSIMVLSDGGDYQFTLVAAIER
jgi:hypothetical protein